MITIKEAIIDLGVVFYILITKAIAVRLIYILQLGVKKNFKLVYIGGPLANNANREIN